MQLRPATMLDYPPLVVMAEDFGKKFLDDYHKFDGEDVQVLIESGNVVVFDYYGYPAGAMWFTDVLDDLHCEMHALIRPEFMKQILREAMLPKGLDWAFERFNVGKVKAEPWHVQKTALKLLRKYKFFEYRPFFKESKMNGRKVDKIPFEMRRNVWRKLRAQWNTAIQPAGPDGLQPDLRANANTACSPISTEATGAPEAPIVHSV